MPNLLSVFRVTALLEGVSYILLLFIATPIKYVYNDPQYVKILGMPHGVLFIAYILLALFLSRNMNWKIKTLAVILIASLVPFGTFYIDKKYLNSSNVKS